jgi:hypothetical protein
VVRVDIGRFSGTAAGDVRYTVPAVRQTCGTNWSVEVDNRSRCVRFPASKAQDVIAALEAMKVNVTVRGSVPAPELPL